MFRGHPTRAGRAALAVFLLAALLLSVEAGTEAEAVTSLRSYKCLVRANAYAVDDHPDISQEEFEARSAWLYEQCAENDAVEGFAEEQGALAPELFPNTAKDRHANPLHCISLKDRRFGLHTTTNTEDPIPEGPGGAAALNIPGEFMYAWIDGKARFLVRYVVWTIDDREGNPITPVNIQQHPTYMGTPQVNVAILDFDKAYDPKSVWVELPDHMALANKLTDRILPGRSLAVRTWMYSRCHDKRYPTNIPQMLIDHVMDLGWLDPDAEPQEPRAIRFEADGDPNLASSWSLVEDPVTLPAQINTRNGYRWFLDDGVLRESVDLEPPSRPGRLKAVAKSATKVKVRWEASADNVGVVGYKVFRDGVEVGFTSELFYADRGLWPETAYEYKVHAVDEAGNESRRSRIRSAVTWADEKRPSRPKNVTVTAGTDSLFVDWDAASDNAAVSHYVVRVYGVVKTSTTDTSFLQVGLEPGTEYHITVRAVDVFGNVGRRTHIYATPTGPQGTYDAVSASHQWRYLDDGSDQGTAWQAAGFDDSSWSSGVGEFGYGDGDETTVVNPGPSDDRHITTYFRATFGLADAATVGGLQLRLVRDDGVVVYLNGVEVYRDNMPAGEVDSETLAVSGLSGSAEQDWIVVPVPTDALANGPNVLAAEVHQVHRTSSDLSFAATLTANP